MRAQRPLTCALALTSLPPVSYNMFVGNLRINGHIANTPNEQLSTWCVYLSFIQMWKQEKWGIIRSVVWTGWFLCMRMESTVSLQMRWSVSFPSLHLSLLHLHCLDQIVIFKNFLRVCVFFCFTTFSANLFSGTGKDPPNYCPAGLYEALQKYPWSPHGSGSQVHPLQLDEWVQALGTFSSCSLPDWRQRWKSKLCQDFVNVWKV